MQFSDFKTLVANYMQRDATLFDSPPGGGQVDKLARAINHSKLWAQRKHRFEYSRVQADVTVDKLTGGDLSTAVLHGTATPVRVRNIDRAYIFSSDGQTIYPIDVGSKEAVIRKLQREVERIDPEYRSSDAVFPNPFVNHFLYQHGTKIYLYPWGTILNPTSTVVVLDIVKWFPDYSGASDEDFFLVEGEDWMLWKSISYLNHYLKDDQRVPVDKDSIADAWASFLSWDESLTHFSGPITLD